MRGFVDLRGASGATYRFRLLPKGETPLRIAGNCAILRLRDDGYSRPMMHLWITNDLSKVWEERPLRESRGPVGVYIRLNVSRATREAEHSDIGAAHQVAEASAAE